MTTTEEAKAIEFRDDNGLLYRVMVEMVGGYISTTPRLATRAHLLNAGFTSNAECARVLNDLQQAHVVEVSRLRAEAEGCHKALKADENLAALVAKHEAQLSRATAAIAALRECVEAADRMRKELLAWSTEAEEVPAYDQARAEVEG